jgi:hypothetical protein
MSKLLEDAVKAARLYAGALSGPIKSQQRLYDRAKRAIARVAAKHNISSDDAFAQVFNEASRRGPLLPTPGKDV